MAWAGLKKYGYVHEAQRLAYRWLYMWVKVHTVAYSGLHWHFGQSGSLVDLSKPVGSSLKNSMQWKLVQTSMLNTEIKSVASAQSRCALTKISWFRVLISAWYREKVSGGRSQIPTWANYSSGLTWSNWPGQMQVIRLGWRLLHNGKGEPWELSPLPIPSFMGRKSRNRC